MNKKILGIGNAITDVFVKVEDNFLKKNNLIKGSMKLVDKSEFESLEKNIKIGGGKKPVPVPPPVPQEDAQSRKRRTRRRRMPDEVDAETKVVQPPKEKEASAPAAPAQPPRQMLPPPSSLISDHLSRYKNYQIAERTTVVTEEKAPVEMIEEPHVDECHACDDEDTSTDISFLIDDELLKRD